MISKIFSKKHLTKTLLGAAIIILAVILLIRFQRDSAVEKEATKVIAEGIAVSKELSKSEKDISVTMEEYLKRLLVEQDGRTKVNDLTLQQKSWLKARNSACLAETGNEKRWA